MRADEDTRIMVSEVAASGVAPSAAANEASSAPHAPATGARRWRFDWTLLWIILAGVALRIATIDTRGLWLDEAVTVDQTIRSLAGTILTQAGGTHPPLFHILMHYWILAFGLGEIALRSFGLLFGALSIPAAYWAGRALYSRRVGIIAALIIAVSPYHIWYSQEARMYTMMLFFGLLSVALLARAIERNTARAWLAYSAPTLLGLFTHYFFAFLVVGQVLYFLFFEVIGTEIRLGRDGMRTASARRPWRLFADVPQLGWWLGVNSVMATALLAWMGWAVFFLPDETSPLILSVSNVGLGYGHVAPSFAVRFNDVGTVIVELFGGFHSSPVMFALVAMWPLSIYVILLLLDYTRAMNRRTRILVWSASGIPLVWGIGQWQGQVLASRYFMALAAPLALLLARLLSRMSRRVLTGVLMALVAVSVVAWADQSFNPANVMRYDNREAITAIVEGYQPGDVVIYEPYYLDVMFDYYLPKRIPSYAFPQYGLYGSLRNGKAQLGQDLDRVVGPSRHVWVFLSFQDVATIRGDAYNTIKWFERNGFRVKRNQQLNHVRLVELEATGARTAYPDGVTR